MKEKKTVVLETEPFDQKNMIDAFEASGHQVLLVEDRTAFIEKIEIQGCDLAVIGTGSSMADSLALLQKIKAQHPFLPVIVAASGADPKAAVDVMKSGAADFFIKPVQAEMVHNICWPVRQGQPEKRQQGADRFAIVTQDQGMKRLLSSARKVCDSQAPILINGESGTGKELVARYVHSCSHRRSHPFVAVNCAALPESLLESELFGHEKGTFTGAVGRKKGKFEQADGGTLLLDEISEMDYSLQAKLLRVLQEREVDRVGGAAPVPVDVRVLATTNRDLESLIESGGFREDLYYRLNVIPLHLPSLRERPGDIPLLSDFFVRKYNRIDHRNVKGLTQKALVLLMNRSWKGNVRELENTIQRAVLMCDGTFITCEDFTMPGTQLFCGNRAPAIMPGVSLREMEKNIIFSTLDHTNDNRTHAAQILGISVRTLRNKLNEYKEKMAVQ
jgi:two-component system, NtrC family, response regulator AtoC